MAIRARAIVKLATAADKRSRTMLGLALALEADINLMECNKSQRTFMERAYDQRQKNNKVTITGPEIMAKAVDIGVFRKNGELINGK